MDVRRVVTGHDADGRSVFVSDEAVAPVTPAIAAGNEFHLLWGNDTTAHFPDDGARPEAPAYFAPVGGVRFGFFTIPPDEGRGFPENLDVAAALAEFDEKLPGLSGYLEQDDPGMHTTDTIDFEVVLSGVATLELDDGVRKELHPGDTVVQNGTRHRWSNSGTVPAVLAVFNAGARHEGVPAGS